MSNEDMKLIAMFLASGFLVVVGYCIGIERRFLEYHKGYTEAIKDQIKQADKEGYEKYIKEQINE